KTGIKTYVSGLPLIRVTMMEKVQAELQLFIALAAAVTAILLLLFFKNLRVMIVCLAVVGIGVTWSLGFIAIFDYPITVLMGLIPPLMIVIGVPNCIYLVNKYHAEYKKHGNKAKALSRVVVKVGNATLLTNATTAMGFATFIFVESDLLREFGVIASVSIMSVFIISVLTIPTVFSFMDPPKRKHVRHLDRKWVFNAVNGLVRMVSHHRTLVYIITAFILVFGVIGISKMETTGNVVDDLPQTDKVITDLRWFEKNYNGVMPFEVLVETPRAGQVTKSKNLKKIEKLQSVLAEYPEFSKSLSIVDASKFAKQAFYNGNPLKYSLISRNEESFIGPYIQSEYNTGGAETTFIDSTKKKTRITAQVADIGTKEMEVLLEDLRPRIDSIFPPQKYKVTLTGTSVVYLKGTSYMVKNLLISLLLAISVIALVMLLLFRSGRMVLIALLPNIIPLVFTGAIMGYAGIPIKPSTILVFSIAFGISVDDTIHFLAKYRQELKVKSWNIKESVLLAVKETGVSMMYTSIVLFFGFGMFSMSEFDGTKALGILVSMTLLVAMFANLVLLPSLLLSFEKYITTKAFKEPLMVIIDEEEDIELEELQVRRQDFDIESDQSGGES
ncbi:MAG: efflux RND transporter permease subunit, partial [Flavobacteriales bacterium]